MEEPMMTETQRDELKSLCQKANVPDKSGECSRRKARSIYIDDLKKQMAQRR